jgi:hypothetical protein
VHSPQREQTVQWHLKSGMQYMDVGPQQSSQQKSRDNDLDPKGSCCKLYLNDGLEYNALVFDNGAKQEDLES